MSEEDRTSRAFAKALADKTLRKRKPLAERSGGLQACPPSASGCPEARADRQAGADSSGRCPEVNGRCCVVCGSALILPIKRAPMPHWILHCNHCGSEVPMFVADDIARWIQSGRWGNAQPKGSSIDAAQCNGQRVLPDNNQAEP
jgi:hypothetical protein